MPEVCNETQAKLKDAIFIYVCIFFNLFKIWFTISVETLESRMAESLFNGFFFFTF